MWNNVSRCGIYAEYAKKKDIRYINFNKILTFYIQYNKR